MPVDACAWHGGLEGYLAVSVSGQADRIIASVDDYQVACAEHIFCSPQVQGLAAAFTLVSSLYSFGNDKRISIDLDAACHERLRWLEDIDPSCGCVHSSLRRLSTCFDGHNLLLRADEMMARLLMECRRMFQESIHLHHSIISHMDQLCDEHGPLVALQDVSPTMHPDIGDALSSLLSHDENVPSCLLLPHAVSRSGDVLIDAALDVSGYGKIHVLLSDFAMMPQIIENQFSRTLSAADIYSMISAHGIIYHPDAQKIAQHVGHNDGISFI
ncbi:MAG: hypothetical protein HRU15_12620 [Planctomycetes bacterium]|nr:hypothetical protein [Planctomycetota bacterium]